MNTRAKGGYGENQAVEYLVRQGYTIIERNYRCRIGEIDCIARTDDGTIVFVEVKAGFTNSKGHPFYRVHAMKQKRIIAVAKYYLVTKKMYHTPCRFDAIALTNGTIEHLKNAFLTG